MKQNLPPAKPPASPIALVIFALALSASACATLPRLPSTQVQSDLAAPKAGRALLVNVNTASPPELENLPGVGRVIAERIIAHREQYGRFRRAEHLMMVRGISDRKFRAIRPLIVVE